MRFWLFLTVLFVAGCGSSSSPPPINMGHIAARSGPGKDAGDQAALGIRLALEELNRDASARPFHVRNLDTQGHLDAFESLAVRLTTVNRVSALIGGDTPEQVAKLARADTLVVSAAGYRPRELGEFVFTTGLTPHAQGAALARFGWEELHKTRWVIVLDEAREEMLLLARAFEKTLADAAPGAKTKAMPKVTTIPLGKNPKMNELGTRVLLENPQGVLLACRTSDGAGLLAELGKPREAVVFAGDDYFQQLAATEQEPIYAATSFVIDPQFKKAEEFAKKFKEAFKSDPDVHAAQAYEGMQLLGEAARRAMAANEKVRDELVKTKDFAGLIGPVSFEADRHLRRPTVVVRWNGMRATLGKVYAKDP